SHTSNHTPHTSPFFFFNAPATTHLSTLSLHDALPILNNTESLVQAISNKDAAATKRYSDAVQAGLKTLTALEAALPADYEVKTYAPLQKGYDAAIKSLKG